MVCHAKPYQTGVWKTPSISIASWNVNCIKNKYVDKGKDKDMIREIQSHDITCLMETHTGGDYSLEIDGFDTNIF